MGFRWWTQDAAERLGLEGTVRNMPDGSVEVRATGSAEALDRLGSQLERGPSSASVRGVVPFEPGSDAGRGRGFRIVR